jgi:hypothetical protein
MPDVDASAAPTPEIPARLGLLGRGAFLAGYLAAPVSGAIVPAYGA